MTVSPASPRPARRSAARILVDALALHGVDQVFGIPGTHNIPIYGALADAGVRHVLMRHEQGCTYAADGYARVSGRPGVVVTTTGPALLNAATALGQAMSDSVPVLLISPGMPTTHPALGNGELHEMRSQVDAMRAIVKSSYRVQSVEEIPATVAACFHDMLSGRPQPVHLELPFDLLHWSSDTPDVAPVHRGTRSIDQSAVARAAELLSEAERPLLVAGGGVSAAAGATLTAIAEHESAPVVTTFAGKGCVNERHPLAAGAGLGQPAVHQALAEADVVLAVGTELAPSDLWGGTVDGPTVIRIDLDPRAALSNAHAAVTVIGDAEEALTSLHALLENAVPARADASWASDVVARVRTGAASKARPWTHLIAGLDQAIDTDAIIAGDSSMACYYGVGPTVPLAGAHRYLYPAGFGTLGFGLPAAVGAALAAPDTRVLALLGDGALMFSVNELAAAAELRLGLPVVVVTNGGYGEIRRQMNEMIDRAHAVDFPAPKFDALATAFGCLYVSASTPDEIAAAVAAAWAADRPTIIEVPEEQA